MYDGFFFINSKFHKECVSFNSAFATQKFWKSFCPRILHLKGKTFYQLLSSKTFFKKVCSQFVSNVMPSLFTQGRMIMRKGVNNDVIKRFSLSWLVPSRLQVTQETQRMPTWRRLGRVSSLSISSQQEARECACVFWLRTKRFRSNSIGNGATRAKSKKNVIRQRDLQWKIFSHLFTLCEEVHSCSVTAHIEIVWQAFSWEREEKT